MRWGVLGGLEVTDDDGAVLALGGQRQRAVLVSLIARRRPATAERLADEVWEGHPPPSASATVQTYVHRLRRTLGRHRIQSGSNGYELRIEPGELDSDAFEQLVVDGDPTHLGEALRLWRGPAYDGYRQLAAVGVEAVRLDELRAAAFEAHLEAALAAGNDLAVIGDLRAAVTVDPLREGLWALLMRALHASGRRAEALRAFQEARRNLVSEAGLEPGPELRRVEAAILADVALDGGSPVLAADSGPRLEVLFGDARWRVRVDRARLSIGSGGANDIVLDDRTVSRIHAVIELVGGAPYLTDCGSRNGTFVHGAPVTAAVRLRDGDVVQVGSAALLFADAPAGAEPTLTARRLEPPALDERARALVVALCRPFADGDMFSDPAPAGTVAAALGTNPELVAIELARVAALLDVDPRSTDLPGRVAREAVRRGAVTIHELRVG